MVCTILIFGYTKYIFMISVRYQIHISIMMHGWIQVLNFSIWFFKIYQIRQMVLTSWPMTGLIYSFIFHRLHLIQYNYFLFHRRRMLTVWEQLKKRYVTLLFAVSCCLYSYCLLFEFWHPCLDCIVSLHMRIMLLTCQLLFHYWQLKELFKLW